MPMTRFGNEPTVAGVATGDDNAVYHLAEALAWDIRAPTDKKRAAESESRVSLEVQVSIGLG